MSDVDYNWNSIGYKWRVQDGKLGKTADVLFIFGVSYPWIKNNDFSYNIY